MKLAEITIGIYFVTALKIHLSHGLPENKTNSMDFVGLLDFQFHGEDPTKIEKTVELITAADWADSWEPPEDMKEWFPYRIFRQKDEKTGNTDVDSVLGITVVFYKEFGKWKFADFVAKRGKESLEDFDKYYEQYLHRLFKEAEKVENDVVAIIDFDGYSIQNFDNRESVQLALRTISTLAKTSRAVKQAYLINTSYVAQTFLNVARPLLGNAMEKAEIYGTQKDKWLPVLLKKLPKEVLPEHYFEKN